MGIMRCAAFCIFIASVGPGAGLALAETRTEQSESMPPISRVVPQKVGECKAKLIANALSGLYKGVELTPVEDWIMVIVGDGVSQKDEKNILHLVRSLDKTLKVPGPPCKDSSDKMPARLESIFHQDATTIVTALSDTVAGVNLRAVGKDRLMIYGKGVADEKTLLEIRRRIALLDLPKPMMSLQVWAFQLSDQDDEDVKKATNLLRSITHDFDKEITTAFNCAWRHVVSLFDPKAKLLDQALYRYLNIGEKCEDKKAYCLEYSVAENAYPSLAKMLVALALTCDPRRHIDAILHSMRLPRRHSGNLSCVGWIPKLHFRHFKRALHLLYGPNRRHLLKAAVADFLFYYKWSINYPDQLNVYGFSRSADQLNSLFAPAFEAFMRDLEIFVGQFDDHPCWEVATSKLSKDKKRNTGLQYSGAIKVAALSGTKAEATGKTVSHFDVTQPPNLATILGNKEQQMNALSPHIGGPLGQALSFLAAARSVQPTIIEISRGITLTVTPKALANGTAAELEVNLAVTQGDPQTIKAGVEKTTAALDRVATHTVVTKVRVETQRLFEISTFANNVTKPVPDTPLPVVGDAWHSVFGATPFLNRLFLKRRAPVTASQRSFVMVQAAVVPTAVDLAWSLWFRWDDTQYGEEAEEEFRLRRKFHQLMRQCLVLPPRYRQENHLFSNGCGSLTFKDARKSRGVQ